ncbi:hypothetical protein LF1_30980 [Rubripirellula obstinata]|uniref:Uncharacterized protein n=1 Tax=Rubripirellula obstinata TaxID=406547 RepID=A0A5B1CH89_9BACT|nr:hypothetical protein LF1_30980 [Rubripirellula obstinata]
MGPGLNPGGISYALKQTLYASKVYRTVTTTPSGRFVLPAASSSIPRHLNFRVAELAKSFGYEGDAESLRDFRYLLTED